MGTCFSYTMKLGFFFQFFSFTLSSRGIVYEMEYFSDCANLYEFVLQHPPGSSLQNYVDSYIVYTNQAYLPMYIMFYILSFTS